MSSYGNQYNTRRSSGRYNTPGQFVPASSESAPPPPPPQPQPQPPQPATSAPAPATTFAGNMRLTTQLNNLHTIQTTDIEMKQEPNEEPGRPAWMKPKLAGVKKKSNKERRRRQNANLRRLLTPKNALMVLNEMLPGEQLATQYVVEPAGAFAPPLYGKPAAFVAQLRLPGQGRAYQGYGETKMAARNAAAEQAIRDLVLAKMEQERTKDAPSADASAAAAAAATAAAAEGMDGDGEAEAEGEEQLPMMQLASFALHKLFSEWEFDGHHVPQLKPPKMSESGGEESVLSVRRPPPAARPPKPPKELPANAARMHPAMLLTYMRPSLAYRELAQEGDRPQSVVFTVGVDVDGNTYSGKGSNKKEARRNAARSACESLFGVVFEEGAAETTPQH